MDVQWREIHGEQDLPEVEIPCYVTWYRIKVNPKLGDEMVIARVVKATRQGETWTLDGVGEIKWDARVHPEYDYLVIPAWAYADPLPAPYYVSDWGPEHHKLKVSECTPNPT